MKFPTILVCFVAFIYPQDIAETINGAIYKGKLIEITDTHIVIQPANSIVPQHIQRGLVQRIVLETGEVVFKEGDIIQSSESTEIDSTSIARIASTTKETIPNLEESMAKIADAQAQIADVALKQYQLVLFLLVE